MKPAKPPTARAMSYCQALSCWHAYKESLYARESLDTFLVQLDSFDAFDFEGRMGAFVHDGGETRLAVVRLVIRLVQLPLVPFVKLSV